MKEETTVYIHIKYSNDGKTFTDNDGEDIGRWVGYYSDTIKECSLDFDKYTWHKLNIEEGE